MYNSQGHRKGHHVVMHTGTIAKATMYNSQGHRKGHHVVMHIGTIAKATMYNSQGHHHVVMHTGTISKATMYNGFVHSFCRVTLCKLAACIPLKSYVALFQTYLIVVLAYQRELYILELTKH